MLLLELYIEILAAFASDILLPSVPNHLFWCSPCRIDPHSIGYIFPAYKPETVSNPVARKYPPSLVTERACSICCPSVTENMSNCVSMFGEESSYVDPQLPRWTQMPYDPPAHVSLLSTEELKSTPHSCLGHHSSIVQDPSLDVQAKLLPCLNLFSAFTLQG